MMTSFDFIIIAVLGLAAAGLLGLGMMFLSKNEKIQRVSFYITAVLGVYIGTVGYRILWPGFETQVLVAVLMALMSIIAAAVERLGRNRAKMFLAARIMAAAALVIGMANAFLT